MSGVGGDDDARGKVERPRSVSTGERERERQSLLTSHRGSRLLPAPQPTSPATSTPSSVNTSPSRTPSPPIEDQSSSSSLPSPTSSLSSPSVSNSSNSVTAAPPTTTAPYTPTLPSLGSFQSTPFLPSSTPSSTPSSHNTKEKAFSPATQQRSGRKAGSSLGKRISQIISPSSLLHLDDYASSKYWANDASSATSALARNEYSNRPTSEEDEEDFFTRTRGQTLMSPGSRGSKSVSSFKEGSQSVIVDPSSGFEVVKEKGSGLRSLLNKVKKKDRKERDPSMEFSTGSSASTSATAIAFSHLTKESSRFLPRFIKKHPSRADNPAQKFPQGCTASHISPFLLPGENVIGNKSSASFPSFYFDLFHPDPPSSVIDGQLLCTNYRLLFVPADKEKDKFKLLNKSVDKTEKGVAANVVSIPYRALLSAKLCDRFCGKSVTTNSKSDIELLNGDLSSALENYDPNGLLDFLMWKDSTSNQGRRPTKLLVISCLDLRREVFFVRHEGIGRIIGSIIQKMDDCEFNIKAVESFSRTAPSVPKFPAMVTPIQSLLLRLNQGEEKSVWVPAVNPGCSLYAREVIFPRAVATSDADEVSRLYTRHVFPQPASVSKKSGAVLWRAPNLIKNDLPLNPLRNFLVSIQTRNIPFFILVAGNRPDFAAYNRLRLPEGLSAGCAYLCSPSSTDIIQAFSELSSYCFGGPLPPTVDITISNGDEESTGITLLEGNIEQEPQSSALKTWLQQFENSRWYGCMSQIIVAARLVVQRMEEGKHVFLGSAVSTVVSILVELMREAENRTIQGFFRLLEREWFQGSYKSSDFNSILNISKFTTETELSMALALSRSTDELPVLLLMLFDCIWQLIAVNPTRFEFTQDLLLALLDEHLMCRFESSLTLSHEDRKRLQSSISLWDYMSSGRFAHKMISSRYDHRDISSTEPIDPKMELIPWTNLYLRFSYRWEMASFHSEADEIPSDFCKLDFMGKGLPWFPLGVLGRWSNIQMLDLSQNSLCFLPVELPHLRHLVGLRLAQNNILQINEKDIGELTALQELDITGNRVQRISGLENLTALLKLKIAGNRLTAMPKLPPSIQRLYASSNSFISQNWNDFPPRSLIYLDLSKCSLSSIRFPLESCINLQTLILSKNQLSQVPQGLASLSHLHFLDLSENILKLIPPPVFKLKHLKSLSLSQCEISTIEESITELQSLERLYLAKNHITFIPAPLFSMQSLVVLDLAGNGLIDLSKNIQQLTKLQELFLSRNEISRIPHEIKNLSQLVKLDISFCRVEHIPPEVSLLSTLKELRIQGNNLKTPPAEIASKGILATMNFLRALCGSDVQLSYKLKISVVGPPLSGKTSVLTKLHNLPTPTNFEAGLSCIKRPISMIGENLQQLPTILRTSEIQPILNLNATGAWPNRKPVTLNFWEFEGAQEYTHTTHKFFLTDRSLYFVVMNLSEPVENAHLDYWLNSIKKGAPQSPIIVIATHMDKVSKQTLSAAVEMVLNEFGNLVDAVVPVSSTKEIGFDRLWEAIEVAIQQALLVGELIPIRFSTLEGLLRTESTNHPLIHWNEFEKLCSYVSIPPSEAESALFMLQKNGSGTFRFTDPQELADWVIIRPSWLVEMVAKLGSQKNLCPNGILHHSLLKEIWSDRNDGCEERYLPFLIQLLLKFQLGFCLTPDVKEIMNRKSFLSILLQKERPSELEKEWPVFSETEWCRRDYTLASLPEGFFARCQVNLLARRPSWTPLLAWANGILIRTNKEVILFEQLPTAKKIQLTIRRYVSGTLFTLVDEDVRSQAKYYNIAVKVTMPCVHCYSKRLYDAYEFTLRECEMALESGSSLVFCHGLVPVRLDKVAPDIALAAVADRKINYNQLQFETFIDEGGYAMVYKAKYNDLDVAVKVLKAKEDWEEKESDSQQGESNITASMEELRREVWIMSGLAHSNIVSLVGYCINPPCIISEFMSEGNLLDLIRDKTKVLGSGLILRIACDISQALEFLHIQLNPPMIHNDLKTPNVLLASTSETAPIVAKLADFGMSRRAAFGNLLEKSSVNPRWLAPEVLQGEAFTHKADIYSFGVIMWELVSRQMFMEDEKFMFNIRDKIVSGARPAVPSDIFPQLAELITNCWASKPEERPDIIDCNKVLNGLLTEKFPQLAEIAIASRVPVRSRSTALANNSGGALNRRTMMPGKICSSELQLPVMTVLNPVGQSTIVGSVRCMTACRKWKQVWCGDGTGRITIFSEGAVVRESLYCHEKEVLDLIATKDAVFSLSTDGTMKTWNKNLELLKSIPVGNQTAIGKVQGKIWVGGDSDILVFDKRSFKNEKKIKLSTADTSGGIITCMLVKKPYVWLGTSTHILRMDIQTMRVVDVLQGHSRIIHKMISVGKEVWSCSSDRSIRVWDKNSGKCLSVLSAHSGRVFCLAVEKSTKPVVWSCAWDATILIWDVESKQMLYECSPTHKDAVSSLVQVGGHMWSGSWDNKLCQWQTVGLRRLLEAAKNGEIESLLQNSSSVFSLAEDTLRLASLNRRKTAKIFPSSAPIDIKTSGIGGGSGTGAGGIGSGGGRREDEVGSIGGEAFSYSSSSSSTSSSVSVSPSSFQPAFPTTSPLSSSGSPSPPPSQSNFIPSSGPSNPGLASRTLQLGRPRATKETTEEETNKKSNTPLLGSNTAANTTSNPSRWSPSVSPRP